MEKDKYQQQMQDYIHYLNAEDKVSEDDYQERLQACMRCNNLLSGICRVCGCYVEMRAAIKARHCPGAHKAW